MTTYLYRLFSADGTLLYVGISKAPWRRFIGHRSRSPWWREVTRSRFEQFDSPWEARSVESHVIRTEKPLYNSQHQPEGMSRTAIRIRQRAKRLSVDASVIDPMLEPERESAA